jgi:uncharacterized protein YxjI
MPAAMYLPKFYLKQKFAMTTNVYRLVAANPDGSEGALMGLAQQKRMALKEQVTFYADEAKTRAVFSFKARAVMELSAGYDIFDETGQQLGYFKKDFGASLLRSTYHLEGPGYVGLGQERSQASALLRRFAALPMPIHFDFVANDGVPLMSSERQMAVRDRYTITVPDERVDFRVAAAVAVAMDAMMER